METNLSKIEISMKVAERLKRKHLSLRSCCDLYNKRFYKEISEQMIRPINKDFVQRIKTNNFKVISERVSKLCELLDIDTTTPSSSRSHFSKEFRRIEMAVGKKPGLENQVRQLLSTVADLATHGE